MTDSAYKEAVKAVQYCDMNITRTREKYGETSLRWYANVRFHIALMKKSMHDHGYVLEG